MVMDMVLLLLNLKLNKMIKDINLMGLYDSSQDSYIYILNVDGTNVGFSALSLNGKLDVYKFVKTFKDNAANNILNTTVIIPLIKDNAEQLESIQREYISIDPSTGKGEHSNVSEVSDVEYCIYTNTVKNGWAGTGCVNVIAKDILEAHSIFVKELLAKDMLHIIGAFNPDMWIRHDRVDVNAPKYVNHVYYEE